jgi:acetolactate synthase-1/2/3 large subunit
MALMNGGQALVKSLAHEGVRVVFGLPGAGQYEALDALYETPAIRYFTTRHEQATSYMADGYARASGEVAAVLVVAGPGFLNATAGMATAYAVSSPMLVVTGAHHQDNRRTGKRDLAGMGLIAQWKGRAHSASDIPQLVQEAFRQMRSGRPRPALLEIPAQVFAEVAEVQFAAPQRIERPAGSQKQIRRAAQMLINARRPVIWAGGGVHRAAATSTLQALAEHLQAPVVTTSQGKGAISDRHPLSLGMAELRYAPLRAWLEERDIILAVGTRTDFSSMFQHTPVIQIDIDKAQLGKADHIFGIAGDAQPILQALYDLVVSARRAAVGSWRMADGQQSPATSPRPSIVQEVGAMNARRFDPASQLQPQWDLMRAIRAAIPDDGILVQDMNQMGYYSRNYYPVYQPRTYLTASQLGTLGAAFPLALGAKVAQPNRAVVALCGDGGFLYNAQELATAVQYGIHVVVIVFNDNAYGNVLRAQLEQFHGHVLGTRLHNPDFVKLAEAYGVASVRVHGAAQLEAMLRQALHTKAPALIEAPVGRMERQY